MNIDFALVNRALLNIGKSPLSATDKAVNNEAWRTAKIFYLDTMLEALSQVEWTGAKRRRELCPAQMPYKGNADFALAFDLPVDCAKPIELDGQEYFEVEAALLYTQAAPARLLYVSNGKQFVDQAVISGGNARRRPSQDCVTGGDAGRVRRWEHGDNFISGGNASRPVQPDSIPEEDYPEYRELRLEPGFYLYWENLLSSKFALRITDKPDLSVTFFNKAQAIGRAAAVESIKRSAARVKPAPTWQEDLGLVYRR